MCVMVPSAGRGWRPPGLVVAALVGIVAFFVIIGLGRAQLPIYPPRYVPTVAVFVLAGVGSLLPLRIPPSARKFALGAALVLGFVALSYNVLALPEGAHLQLERDLSSLRCEPPAAPGP
jgi:hypothetical protein